MRVSSKRGINISPTAVSKQFKRRRTSNVGRLSPHEECFPRNKKHVKFAFNMDGTIKTWERFIDIPRKDLDKASMFYSREEKEDLLEECEINIDHFKQESLDEISNFELLFRKCSEPPSCEATQILETTQLNIPAQARGMEWGWAGAVMGGYKKAHVKNLIRAQTQIKSLREEMRTQILASRSLKSSRTGRVVARLLGECDERNARNGQAEA